MANEKRLIDANALADKVEESKYNNPHPQGMIRVNHRNEHDHFFRMICEAPTVDAVEVVHSEGCKWCNGEYHTKIMATAIRYHSNGNIDGYELKVNYCPNCGAKMDGEGGVLT